MLILEINAFDECETESRVSTSATILSIKNTVMK